MTKKNSIMLATILIINVLFNVAQAHNEWNKFKQNYNRTYASEIEEKQRLSLFNERLKFIQDHNSRLNVNYKLTINQFSDLNDYELKSFIGRTETKSGIHLRDDPFEQIDEEELSSLVPGWMTDPPDSVDWRRRDDVVGPIKRQGRCGSCWAFAVCGLIEGQQHRLNKNDGPLIPLSEQQLIDCDYNNRGCAGGFIIPALNYVKEAGGIMKESDYPYELVDDNRTLSCRFDKSKIYKGSEQVREIRTTIQGDERLLKKVVASYGPVAVSIQILDDFAFYESGVYSNPECGQESNHAALLVGYGTDENNQDYWIIKNSWSEDWGIKGYFYLARNKKNLCGIAEKPAIYFGDLYYEKVLKRLKLN